MRFHQMRSREDLFPGTDKVELFLSGMKSPLDCL